MESVLMGDSDFGYFPKMLKTWGLLMVVRNATSKITVIFSLGNDAISSHECPI